MSDIASVRLPDGTVTSLKLLAAEETLKRGYEVRWTTLRKEAIAALLKQAKEVGDE